MSKKLIFLCMALGLCLAPAVQAANIIWVSDAYDERADGIPDDQAGADFIASLGHTVDYQRGASFGNGYWRTLDAAKIAALNAADLVIVSRNSDSGNYDDADEIAQWNGITAPLILMTPYISRNSRWIWYNNATLSEDGGTPTLVAVDPHHPIFNGVNLNSKNEVDIYDQAVGSGTVSFPGVLDQGNGTLLAQAISGTRTIIAEWAAGKPFYAGGAQTPAGKRMIFCGGTREGSGFGRGEFNLNDEGKKLLANAIEYMLGNLVREPWVKAWQPNPADGTTNVQMPLLRWAKGETAVAHDVYLGTTPDLTAADLVSPRNPMAIYYPPFALLPGTKYYWRIDEVELDGTTHTGDVWSFTTPSLVAFSPQPLNGAKWIDPDAVTLLWQPGQNAISHDVYFGTDKQAVTDGTGGTSKGNVVAPTFDPGPLTADTTYFWRVDEVLFDKTKRAGNVWSFTTLAPGGGIRGLYFGNRTLDGLPVINQIDPQINFNWATVPVGLTANNFSVRWVGELDVPFSETYTFYPTTDDGVRLWVNDVQLLDLWTNRRAATEAKASIELAGGRRYPIVMEFYSFDGTAIAELRWESPSIAKDLIPQAAFSPPLRASSPVPGNGAVNVPQTSMLTWNAGEKAEQHVVYFGDDADAVADATSGGSNQAAAVTTFDPGTLEWGKTYYWRVDEVNDAEADSPWKGSVWSFTTADFIVVDDFESYNDEEGTNTRIYETWFDGWTAAVKNGATVGNWDPPFAEQVIVHGGRQSMPIDYNNTNAPFYSEAYREFAPVQNWTVKGVTDLVLWLRGNPVSFVDKGGGAFTISGAGHDIWDDADDFRFAWKRLNGNGSITVKVESVVNTNAWAKGGVMIRETLDPSSKFAYVVSTPAQGVSFGWRPSIAGTCSSATQAGLPTAQWVKLTRTGDVFTGQYSADGQTWTDIENADGTVASTTIAMAGSVYIGLCVTSHNAAATTTVEFSGQTATGGVSGAWQVAEIGDDPQLANSPQPLYVTVEDSTGKKATVMNPDPGAANVTAWTEWKTPLSSFAGVSMTKVKRLYIGIGDKNPDGTGRIYIDDIRVTKPEPAEPVGP